MMMKYFFNLILVGLLVLPSTFTQAQYEHTLDGSLDAADEINVRHRRGSLRVLPSTDGKVSWKLRLSFDSKEKSEADKLIGALSINANKTGNRIDIDSQLPIKNMRTVNGRSTIELKDGSKIKNVRNVQVSLLVYAPKVSNLKVDNRYEPIEVRTDVTNTLEVVTYDGEVSIGDISGSLYLSAKYSKGKIGNAKKSKIELYDSKIEFGALGETELNAKYSTLRSPSIASIRGEIYEGKIYVGQLEGTLQVNAKYSKFEFDKIGDGLFEFYETDLIAESAQNIQAKTKYGEIRIKKMNNLNMESSYEDDIIIGELNNMTANESKYSNYNLGRLTGALELSSYEDDIEVSNPASSIKSIRIKGKYTKLNCILPPSMRYQVKLESRYTNIDIGENDLEFSTFQKKGDTLNFEGKSSGATSSSPMLAFNCYECKLNLK